MLRIYGNKPLRTVRCLWALEELELPYEQILVPDRCAPAFLALNPAGKVPVLVDGDFVLTESVAINAYLAAKRPTPLWPENPCTRARIDQWTSWAITEFEFPFTTMVRELRRAGRAGEAPDAGVVGACLQGALEALAPLEQHLAAGNAHVAGDAFTIGDVNACFPVAGLAPRLDMAAVPHVVGWVERCTTRDAWARVQAIDEGMQRSL